MKKEIWGVLTLPVIILFIWYSIGIVIDSVETPLDVMLILAGIRFFFEMALFFCLALYVSAVLTTKYKADQRTVVIGYIALFLAYLAIDVFFGLAGSDLSGIITILLCASVIIGFKSLPGILGAALGRYIPSITKSNKWEDCRGTVIKISAAVMLLALIAGYILGTYLSENIGFNLSPGFGFGLDKCNPGETAEIRLLVTSMNMTVIGKTTYRGREVCHSVGEVITPSGVTGEANIYMIDSETYCMLGESYEDGEKRVKEECEGEWPGYVPSPD